jgi:MFS family permease
MLHRLFPRLFYGWLVAAGASVLSFAGVGIGFYSLPLLLDALCQTHGWSRTSVSGATSLYIVVGAVTGTLVGRSIDRRGARGFIVAGACVMAAALWAIGRATSTQQLYLLYPVMAVGFAMCAGVPTQAIVTRWFVVRRALAMSVAFTGVSVVAVSLKKLGTLLIHSRGLDFATAVLALLLVAVALPVAAFVLRFDPLEFGLVPDGANAPLPRNELLGEEAQRRRWRTREALGTSTFWLLALAFATILFAQQSMLIHQIAFMREPLGPTGAALGMSTTAGGSIVGRLAVGSFADRVDKRRLALVLFLVQAGIYLLFAEVSGRAAFYAVALVFGFTIGNVFMMQSLLVGELFGLRSFGSVFGMLGLMVQPAAGLGPYAMGLLFEFFGGYEPALRVLAVLALLAASVLTRVKPPAPLPAAVPAPRSGQERGGAK